MTSPLPITAFIPDVITQLARNNVVLQAEPGAGKSTALPLSLLNAPWLNGKKIIMLEPRRVAAKSIAHYLALQLGEKAGGRVGYHIKNDRKISSNTQLEVVTEGVLTRRLQNDPELSDISLIIFDEFHERSIHADLALMLSLEVQESLRDDLKLLVMSATIDSEEISVYLNNASVINCPGRQYPVSLEYQNVKDLTLNRRSVSQGVCQALTRLFSETNKVAGDILVFLSGQGEITQCIQDAQQLLSNHNAIDLLPLYGSLSINEQEKVLSKSVDNITRIIFTTNIAETSLTIDGVSYVIDSGLEKTLVYDPSSNMTRLETSYISKASAEQRKGRAGRLQAGHCIRLWSEAKHNTLADHQTQEICAADLSGLLLELFIWGQADYHEINWLTAPPKPHFDSAKQLLQSLSIIDERDKVTHFGQKVASLALEPRLSAMLFRAETILEKNLACELAALLASGDIFYGRQDADIVARLLALQEYQSERKNAVQNYPLKVAIIEQVLLSANKFKQQLNVNRAKKVTSLSDLQHHTGRLLLTAFPDRLAKRRGGDQGRYQLANGRGVILHESDGLFNEAWLIVADCNAKKKEGIIYTAATIAYSDITECLAEQITTESRYFLDEKKTKILGRQDLRYQALSLNTENISVIPQQAFTECIRQLIKTEGLSLLNWTKVCQDWLARVQWLAEYIDDLPKLSEKSLMNDAERWLLPYLSKVSNLAALKKINVYELVTAVLTWEQQQVLAKEAPVKYQTPSNKQIDIIYDKHQGPTVSVVLQEMFGELISPCIANGKVPLRFELLSPARRPAQTTSDLANFWQHSYFAVAKDMKAQYPRHRWPDKPLEEKPGGSRKPRVPRKPR